jgi:NAD(P)-dependent dehydrogenase (short-subunit alcohol dehydrogenase family)
MKKKWTLEQMPSLKGRIIIVTGANSGIGFETAKVLASKGAQVILACRNHQKGIEAKKRIIGLVEYINLDLTNFNNIKKFCQTIHQKYEKVDILVNNAGVMFPPFTKTKENLELTFATNYIGYYLLSLQLLPMMKAVQGSRIVNVSSIAQYRINDINWESLNSKKLYRKQEVYALSNLFRIMFTLDLETRLREKKLKTVAISCHPGVALTNLTRHLPKFIGNSLLTKIVFNLFFQSPYEAAKPLLMASTEKNLQGGDFIGLDTRNQFKGNPVVVDPNPLVFNEKLRKILWKKAVDMTGIDF